MTASAPRPSRPSRWTAPVAAAVVAAGAGMGIGWLLWSGPDSAASGTGFNNAAAGAVGACQAWQRVPSLDATYDNGDKEERTAHYERAVGAAALGPEPSTPTT